MSFNLLGGECYRVGVRCRGNWYRMQAVQQALAQARFHGTYGSWDLPIPEGRRYILPKIGAREMWYEEYGCLITSLGWYAMRISNDLYDGIDRPQINITT